MRRNHAHVALAGAVLLLAAVTGCGGGGSTAGSDSPTQAVAAFMHALGDKDSGAACAQVSTGGKPLQGAGLDQCKEGLDKVLAALNDPAEIAKLRGAQVTGAKVTGDKATVSKDQINGVPEGYQNDIDLVRIGGRWFIDSKQ